jgi:ribosomal protein L29
VIALKLDASVLDRSAGGAPENPGLIRALRTNIARILTVQKEEEEK